MKQYRRILTLTAATMIFVGIGQSCVSSKTEPLSNGTTTENINAVNTNTSSETTDLNIANSETAKTYDIGVCKNGQYEFERKVEENTITFIPDNTITSFKESESGEYFILDTDTGFFLPEGTDCISQEASDEINRLIERDQVMQKMNDSTVTEDEMITEVVDEGLIAIQNRSYDIIGTLDDVSGGSAFGTAKALFTDNTYTLYVTMEDLPALENNFFYEGWIVQEAPMNVISTGKIEQLSDGTWSNTYMSKQDLTDHTFYVLTLEPNDGDPTPATHMLKGKMQ